MNDRTPTSPPRLLVLRTADDILHHTTILTTRHHLLMVLFISFLLFSLHAIVETATHPLISFIDNDPSIKSLLSQIHLPQNPPITSTRPRRPFLQLTRVRTLDDDFVSGGDEIDHRFFGRLRKPQLNATSFILDSFDPQFGFSNFVSDNGIRVSETIRSSAKMSFRSIDIIEKEKNVIIDNSNDTLSIDDERTGLQNRDLATLLILVVVSSVSYGFVTFLYLLNHACVHGVIFVLAVNDFLIEYNSFLITFWNGASLGLKRLSGLMVMRWLVRDALVQFLGAWSFFGEIEDQYSILKIFVRMKFLPFSTLSPWIEGFDREIYGFMLSWFLLDMLVSFVFDVVAWVVMVDPRKNGKEIVKEGCYLLSLMPHPAINIKCLEVALCGPIPRWVVTHSFGKLYASVSQSFLEVYFMMAWLLYYFSVKSIDANSSGVPFGRRELEAMLEDIR